MTLMVLAYMRFHTIRTSYITHNTPNFGKYVKRARCSLLIPWIRQSTATTAAVHFNP